MTTTLATCSALSFDLVENTSVDGLLVRAPNADYTDDTKGALLSRTVARVLARGFAVDGVYIEDEGRKVDQKGWVWVGNYASGLLARRTHLIDVSLDGEQVGTVRVVEARWLKANRLLGRDEHGREIWREQTEVAARVEAERAVLATLRG